MHQVVSRNGMLIRYASVEIRQNRQIVLIAAKQDGGFLCENNFQMYWDDREIALAASISSWEFLPCIPNHFISDPEFLDGIISNARNIKKVFLIPKNLLFSNNGVLNLNSGDKLLLLIRLIEYDFLTKEAIEKLEIELLNNNQKTDTIKFFYNMQKEKECINFNSTKSNLNSLLPFVFKSFRVN